MQSSTPNNAVLLISVTENGCEADEVEEEEMTDTESVQHDHSLSLCNILHS
jgi:hypothetical protein